jgi:hypothetical protein
MLDVGLWEFFMTRISAFLEPKRQMLYFGINQAAINTNECVKEVSGVKDNMKNVQLTFSIINLLSLHANISLKLDYQY